MYPYELASADVGVILLTHLLWHNSQRLRYVINEKFIRKWLDEDNDIYPCIYTTHTHTTKNYSAMERLKSCLLQWIDATRNHYAYWNKTISKLHTVFSLIHTKMVSKKMYKNKWTSRDVVTASSFVYNPMGLCSFYTFSCWILYLGVH